MLKLVHAADQDTHDDPTAIDLDELGRLAAR